LNYLFSVRLLLLLLLNELNPRAEIHEAEADKRKNVS
jgi:hypothetical protein